jgi:hypothetical protein
MANIPPDKEISFLFNRNIGLKQFLVPRDKTADGCYVQIDGVLSASHIVGVGTGSVGPQGEQGPPGTTLAVPSFADFSSDDFYAAPPGNLRGNADGFTACVLVRPEGFPTSLQSVFGTWTAFQPNGGWFIGIDADRFKIGVGRQSDSTIQENFGTGLQGTSQYQGRFIRRFFLLHLAYNAGSNAATLYVNGQSAQTINPVDGFQLADAETIPYIGRNNNNSQRLPATNIGFSGAGYVEETMSAQAILNHYKDCLNVDGFTDAGFSNYWQVVSGSSALEDQVGSVDFVLNGTLTEVITGPRW